jgi:hypothetical protein
MFNKRQIYFQEAGRLVASQEMLSSMKLVCSSILFGTYKLLSFNKMLWNCGFSHSVGLLHPYIFQNDH